MAMKTRGGLLSDLPLLLLSRLIPAVPDGHEGAPRPIAAPPPRAFRLVPAIGGIRPVL